MRKFNNQNNVNKNDPNYKKFGELAIGQRFIFNEIEFRKIDEGYGKAVQSGRKVEFGYSLRVLVL